MKDLVIYHKDCADGFGAAYAAWLNMSYLAEYLPMNYNDKLEVQVEGRNVYILDFSFPLNIMEDICDKAEKVIWLDHHATSKETALQLVNSYPNAHINHSDTKSGAILAWEYFHPGKDAPLLIKHIDDRDRWQFKMCGTKEVSAALWSHRPWTFGAWDNYTNHDIYSQFITEGAAILRAQNAEVTATAKKSYPITISDQVGLAVNTDTNISEVGHELANQSGTFGLIWYLDKDRTIKCSLRSNGDYDVAKIAAIYGGGGHKNAAGFTLSADKIDIVLNNL